MTNHPNRSKRRIPMCDGDKWIFDLRLVVKHEATAAPDVADALRQLADRIDNTGFGGVYYVGGIGTGAVTGHYSIHERESKAAACHA